ncbi:hypothetical protein D3C80_1826000 [compost metagenome]
MGEFSWVKVQVVNRLAVGVVVQVQAQLFELADLLGVQAMALGQGPAKRGQAVTEGGDDGPAVVGATQVVIDQ